MVLEPSTEGRLAARLARRGEGVCALYVVVDARPGGDSPMIALGLPGRLATSGPAWGPFVIEVVYQRSSWTIEDRS